MALSYWGIKSLLAMIPDKTQLPRMDTIHLDGAMFLFSVGLASVTAVVFGLIPTLQVSQPDPNYALRYGATGNSTIMHYGGRL